MSDNIISKDTQTELHKYKKKKTAISFFLIIICGISIGLSAPFLLNIATSLGHNIPQEELATDYLIGLIWAVILGLSILIWPVPSRHKTGLIVIWSAKIFITLGFMLLYEAHYSTLDAYSYFSTSNQSWFTFNGFKIGAGTANIINIAWLHNQVLPVSYHALKVSFAMIGLVAVYIFYLAAVIFMKRENKYLLYAFALFPSILFWSSIIGKDPIILFGVSLYTYGVIGWYRFEKLRFIWILVSGLIIIAFIRLWMVPILFAPLSIFFLRSRWSLTSKTAIIVFSIGILLFMLNYVTSYFNIGSIQQFLDFINFYSHRWAYGGSSLEVPEFNSIFSLIIFIPLGAFTALFRPLPGDVMNFFGILAGLENLFLLILLFRAVKKNHLKDLKEPIILWAVLLILTWAIVYSFISYQNLGTAVRFKLQVLPILLGLLFYLGRQDITIISEKNNVRYNRNS